MYINDTTCWYHWWEESAVFVSVFQELDYPFMEAGQPVDLFSQKVRAGDQFMDIQSVTDHKLDIETTVLEWVPFCRLLIV